MPECFAAAAWVPVIHRTSASAFSAAVWLYGKLKLSVQIRSEPICEYTAKAIATANQAPHFITGPRPWRCSAIYVPHWARPSARPLWAKSCLLGQSTGSAQLGSQINLLCDCERIVEFDA